MRLALCGILWVTSVLASAEAVSKSATSPFTLPDWISGTWCGNYEGDTVDSQYSSAAGGVILGYLKFTDKDGDLTFFEHQSIAIANDQMVLQLYPFGEKGQPLVATISAQDTVTFENAKLRFPKIASFTRVDGGVDVNVSGLTEDDKPLVYAFRVTQCPLPKGN